MKIARPLDPSLLIENEGTTWNFPAGRAGTLTTRIYIPAGSQGARINLSDRWFNPVDTTAHQFSMYSVSLGTGAGTGNSLFLEEEVWHTLRFEWDGLDYPGTDHCRLFLNQETQAILIPLERESIHGISYVHFISTAQEEDLQGLMIESVNVKVQ